MVISAGILCFYLICIVLYAVHFVLFKLSRSELPQALRSTASLRAMPVISVIVSSILALVAIKNQSNGLANCSEEERKINPDIGGSIDAISASTSMAYSNKDVLASRKLVYTGFLIQLAAFATEGAVLWQFLKTENLACVSSIQHPVLNNLPKSLLLAYLSIRVVLSSSLTPILGSFTKQLDALER